MASVSDVDGGSRPPKLSDALFVARMLAGCLVVCGVSGSRGAESV